MNQKLNLDLESLLKKEETIKYNKLINKIKNLKDNKNMYEGIKLELSKLLYIEMDLKKKKYIKLIEENKINQIEELLKIL